MKSNNNKTNIINYSLIKHKQELEQQIPIEQEKHNHNKANELILEYKEILKQIDNVKS
jgi:hypothetical protein